MVKGLSRQSYKLKFLVRLKVGVPNPSKPLDILGVCMQSRRIQDKIDQLIIIILAIGIGTIVGGILTVLLVRG